MPVAVRTPGGLPLSDGYQSIITLADAPTIELYEKTVQPIGFEGGEKIRISTMHNVAVHTYAPRFLQDTPDAQMTVAYDPTVLTAIKAQINVNQKVTITFPNGDKWNFDGYLRNFQPAALEEGVQPTATCVIVPTNVDSDSLTGAELAPAYVAAV